MLRLANCWTPSWSERSCPRTWEEETPSQRGSWWLGSQACSPECTPEREASRTGSDGELDQTKSRGERRQVSVWRWSRATHRALWWSWTASRWAALCFYLLSSSFFFPGPDYGDIKVSGRVWRKQWVVIVTVKQEQIVTNWGRLCLGAAGWVVPPPNILDHFQEGWNFLLLWGLKSIGFDEALLSAVVNTDDVLDFCVRGFK